MTDMTIDEEAEQFLTLTAEQLTGVREQECLFCYVARMLGEHGCDTTLRFARSYRDQRAPRATAIERRMGQLGGFCDCEIFLNGMTLGALSARLRRGVGRVAVTRDPTGLSRCPSRLDPQLRRLGAPVVLEVVTLTSRAPRGVRGRYPQQAADAVSWAGDGSMRRLVQHSWPSPSPWGVALSPRTV